MEFRLEPVLTSTGVALPAKAGTPYVGQNAQTLSVQVLSRALGRKLLVPPAVYPCGFSASVGYRLFGSCWPRHEFHHCLPALLVSSLPASGFSGMGSLLESALLRHSTIAALWHR